MELGNTSNVKWFAGIGEYVIDWGSGYRIYLAKDGNIESCAIVSMPAILARNDRDAWLTGTAAEVFAALKQCLVATPVSTRINAPKNNDANLIEPLAAQQLE